MGKTEEFVVCMVKHDLTKMILKIYQPCINTKTTKKFHEYADSLMKFNTSASLNKRIVSNQETYTKITNNSQKRYRSGI